MRKSLTLAALVAIAACGSLDTDIATNECSPANWKSFGFEDGVRGLENKNFSTRNEACAKDGVDVRRSRYMAGYDEGVARFCTAENGYNQGATGYVYTGICPISMEEKFVKALGAGHRASQEQNVAGNL